MPIPQSTQPTKTKDNWQALKHREFDQYMKFLEDGSALDGICPFKGAGGKCSPSWEKCNVCEHYDLIHAGFLDYICPDCGKWNALSADVEPIRTTDPTTAGTDSLCWTAWYKCPLCGAEIEVEEST